MSDHQYMHPFIALPRTGALLFAGSAFYIGWIDHFARDSIPNVRHQLTHWATSFKFSSVIMASLAAGTTALGLKAYEHTK